MLVLARKPGQKIVIYDNITIEILDIKGDHVKIGISAPKDVPIHREEVFKAIREENLSAAMQTLNITTLPQIPKK